MGEALCPCSNLQCGASTRSQTRRCSTELNPLRRQAATRHVTRASANQRSPALKGHGFERDGEMSTLVQSNGFTMQGRVIEGEEGRKKERSMKSSYVYLYIRQVETKSTDDAMVHQIQRKLQQDTVHADIFNYIRKKDR